MMISEALRILWQTMKDLWEELYSLAAVNLVCFLASLTAAALAWHFGTSFSLVVFFPFLILALGVFSATLSGMYYVTYRVAQGKTFHFNDFAEGIKKFWWRSLSWILVNIVAILLVQNSRNFYRTMLEGWPEAILGGLLLGLIVAWLAIQLYFWPSLIAQKEPKMLLAWRNSAFLFFASPVYSLLIGFFSFTLIALSTVLIPILIFAGMALITLLGNNATLNLLQKFEIIEDMRPHPPL